ncbi:hypothetical protein C7W88_05040 [Novosphingobium sp. THN1]|nr:hypothetical protein C7W88_05040 [Novosphingobium sp. THN1]
MVPEQAMFGCIYHDAAPAMSCFALSVYPTSCLSGRHAELVSASISPHAQPVHFEGWTLKQVQGDGGLEARHWP